ncbi:hypothetical protein QE152_g7652 [Popillia japonica]|uniref:Uncharacterized protein n=1 Tax=Popillia japonica TaxID=7064 RepID=A0AAW1MEC2_POPJA
MLAWYTELACWNKMGGWRQTKNYQGKRVEPYGSRRDDQPPADADETGGITLRERITTIDDMEDKRRRTPVLTGESAAGDLEGHRRHGG